MHVKYVNKKKNYVLEWLLKNIKIRTGPVLGTVLITVSGKCGEMFWFKKKTDNLTKKTEAKIDASKVIFLFTTVFHFSFLLFHLSRKIIGVVTAYSVFG